ncbi:PREDICTED: PI-PLC X domain-containing protein 3 [Ceratosolen solmsi marchali]|uniref:PI-PLC X domain-containing protein 3 n=1 Tax=Ceratosolen solmsi marchali TaxID=326594 RepID=A0AAJ6YVM8_9HYME|nr:PREDICTED: PI-PLC X domain-containing protein 3 [Ceratosolen solmsi marchali]
MQSTNLENQSAIIDIKGAQDGVLNLCENLELWMTYLPSKLRGIPIIHLAIPGSHNSMTCTIEKNNCIGPDEPALIRAVA